jgi:hypothetical protein
MRTRRPALASTLATALAASLLSIAAVQVGAAGAFVEDVSVIYELHDENPGVLYGWAVSELDDIDGDGVGDFITSAPLYGPSNSGRTFVYSGATGALIYSFAEGPGELHGYAIADAGDVDADGLHDILVGARDGNHAYVYSGATGGRLLTLSGEAPGDAFGFAVAGAGDTNADGRADLLVGATRHSSNAPEAGRVYLISGADGTTIRTWDGESAGDHFGSGVDSVADTTGDGVAEVVVGARDAGKFRDGSVALFSGATGTPLWAVGAAKEGEDLGWFFVAGVGDVNGDGTADVYGADFSYSDNGDDRGAAYILSGADGTTLRSWLGSSPREGMGPGREAGDVDGDGVEDLAVGSYLSSDGVKQAGKAEVFSGADGSRLRVITSLTRDEQLGFDALGIGDVNADGIPDLLLTAANGNAIYVVAGQR